ncbi:MAG TPA: hypothetical protein PLX06_05620 [Fimbriimonadaceae bacterium]|nr:hypothetical protein [Fimbriimonadaceae bacterium]
MNQDSQLAGSSAPRLVNSVPDGTSLNRIEWSPEGLQVHSLFLGDPEIVLLTKDRDEEEIIRRVALATTIGAKALNQGEQALNVDFVRHLLEQHVRTTTTTLGDVVAQTRSMIDEHLDGENGKALAPIRLQIQKVQEGLTSNLADVLSALDPTRPESDLGKALGKLGTLLDDQNINSVPARVKAIVDRLGSQDGALAASVKATVQEAMKVQIEPLREQIKSLEKEITDKKAVADLVSQTTAKGLPFEEEVFARCKSWALAAGGQAEHVGVDNKPGDVLITFAPDGMAATDLRVVVEARDDATAKGRKPIGDDLSKAMAHREADAGIYCGKNNTAFAREIGDWDEGSVGGKQWIACTVDQLPQALRLILLTKRVRDRASAAGAVDAAGVNASLVEIRVALRRVATIKRASTAIANSATSVQSESDALLRQIETALSNAEHAMRASAATDQAGLEI